MATGGTAPCAAETRMASRPQTSFFDKTPRTSHSRWNPNRTQISNNVHPQSSSNPATSIAPFKVSAHSRSKLQAYRFQNVTKPMEMNGCDGSTENNAENAVPDNPCTKNLRPQHPLHSQSRSQMTSSNIAKQCPQTPVDRLPLAELITNGEEYNQVLSMTPVERVLWGTSARSSEPGTSAETRDLPRSRKRAYSSSPASSSHQRKVSKHFGIDRSPARMHNSHPALKTPQGDPAGELWNRYALNIQSNEKQSPTKSSGQSFPLLMHSSSPPTPAQSLIGKDSGNLRRSFSCGTEWPASAAKRRKLQHNVTRLESPTLPTASEQHVSKNSNSRSRISLLVDKIHGDLANPSVYRTEYSIPSDVVSSTTGQNKSVDEFLESPKSPVQPEIRTRKCQPILRGNEDSSTTKLFKTSNVNRSRTHEYCSADENYQVGRESKSEGISQAQDAYSDFGDDDLDLEMCEAVDRSIIGVEPIDKTVQKCVSSTSMLSLQFSPDKAEGDDSRTENQISSQAELSLIPLQKRRMAGVMGVDDDFYDGANDVSVEDLEDAVAKFDSHRKGSNNRGHRPHEGNPSQMLPSNKSDFKETFEGNGGPKIGGSEKMGEVLSDDEFGGDIEFDEIATESNMNTATSPALRLSQLKRDKNDSMIQRYLIMTVAEGEYQPNEGQRRLEKVLLVQDECTNMSKAITLRQSWIDTPCTQGAYVHLIGKFDQFGQCIVDDTQNLLILHPDFLISATVVADSFTCSRRAILQDRVKATGDSSEPQVYGSILHEIFQEAMRFNRWDEEWLTGTIKRIVDRFMERLFEIGVDILRAVDHLKSRVVEMQAWAKVFVAAKPKENALVRDRNGAQAHMSITKLLDVEEKIWSPRYGLKGMVDATVQITLRDEHDEKRLTVPFELKTGKNPTAAHKAQTALYTLLCSDRYDLNIACGILYYMETSETSRIPAIRHELIHMIKQRNKLAGYVREKTDLPPMLQDSPHLCQKCYAQKACFIYHKLVDDGSGETSGLQELFDEQVKHLQPVHQQFFQKWDSLLTKEERDVVKIRRELWSLQSSEREKLGRCFGNVIIQAGSYAETSDAPKINRFCYTFVKQNAQPGFSFTESQMTIGEPIVISDERGHFALASGYVTRVRKDAVQVTIDRRLHNSRSQTKYFDAENNQSFAGIMEVTEQETGHSTITPLPNDEVIYRIDKDEFSNGMATVRNNLINIMEKDAFNAQPLRRLIIEYADPTFRSPSTGWNYANSASQASLNIDQKHAIEKVMCAKDYALVLGMPGTGKTTTIAHIIRALAAQGKSVLLTSYTHTAVDNILLKIRKDNIGIFRLGAVAKVHPEVQEFAELGGRPMQTIEDLKRAYGQQIVATTCLGINHPIFTQRIFDYCIVDEASQITLPVCLGPLRMARTFVLVGDHYQLPPLVQNKEAQDGGLDVSLFRILSDRQPASVVNLEHQYRMCEEIMCLSNTLIYNGRLKCGTLTVAKRSVTIPNIEALEQHHHSSCTFLASVNNQRFCQSQRPGVCWLLDLLEPSVKACFVNTDPLWPASREAETGSRITNSFEARVCQQLVESLITVGVSQTEIGIITLYRSQLALIKHMLRHRTGVEMHTADRFQGRDKEVVVLSLVRSNESGNVGELLKDWRRVNVALTRARTKLLVLGSKKTLEGNGLLKDFVKLVEDRGWRYDLPPGALESHVFTDSATQISAGPLSGKRPSKQPRMTNIGEEHPTLINDENTYVRSTKQPGKKGMVDVNNWLEKRRVLRDIINEAS